MIFLSMQLALHQHRSEVPLSRIILGTAGLSHIGINYLGGRLDIYDRCHRLCLNHAIYLGTQIGQVPGSLHRYRIVASRSLLQKSISQGHQLEAYGSYIRDCDVLRHGKSSEIDGQRLRPVPDFQSSNAQLIYYIRIKVVVIVHICTRVIHDSPIIICVQLGT